uniref:Uncharacterized protein n=1 Tax=Anguilla anguilla TaxID=7936 RepID=A0A0E9TX62_ANGAN
MTKLPLRKARAKVSTGCARPPQWFAGKCHLPRALISMLSRRGNDDRSKLSAAH